jgi:diadenosine tetraphosphate (Ap4A) HIT family hydrolase
MMPCPFCEPLDRKIVAANDLAIAFRDAYPVSEGHTLVVPRRHVSSWFDTTEQERTAIFALGDEVKTALDNELRPDGYNLGINIGETAGQTVMHLHLHVIPRHDGDVEEPAGGVRHVIPGRGNYRRAL